MWHWVEVAAKKKGGADFAAKSQETADCCGTFWGHFLAERVLRGFLVLSSWIFSGIGGRILSLVLAKGAQKISRKIPGKSSKLHLSKSPKHSADQLGRKM